MANLKVAVHQPNYLPWLGFFQKIERSDIFVFLDNVQFPRRSYSNRVLVMGPNENVLWISQSVIGRPTKEQSIEDVQFSDDRWKEKHLKTLKAAYGKCPFFKDVFPFLENAFCNESDRLAIFNGELIRHICDKLGLPTAISYASQLKLGSFTSPSERIACITRHFGSDVYLSGAGARAYNDTAVYEQYGVRLEYSDFAAPPYPQRSTKFTAGLSIVDALFNIGFSGVAALLRQHRQCEAPHMRSSFRT
jgi:WbqC-like protein family